MVHHSMKKSPNVLLLLLLYLSKGFGYVWMDERAENQNFDDSENRIDDEKFFNKRIERISVTPDIFKRTFHTLVNSAPIYRTTNHKHCNCEMSSRPIDLGQDYYPRYVQTGTCQPNSCEKFYKCIEKNYRMKVLRKKDLKDANEVLSSSSLPKSLRNYWVEKTILVGVACECVVDIQGSFTDGL